MFSGLVNPFIKENFIKLKHNIKNHHSYTNTTYLGVSSDKTLPSTYL